MTRKKKALVVAIVLIIAILLISLAVLTTQQRDDLTFVEKGLRIVASPIQHAISNLGEKVGGFFGAFTDYDQLQKENQELMLQIEELSIANNDLQEALLENIRLKQMLEFKDATSNQYTLAAAKVIAENNNNLQHTIVLDKGSDDGIQNNVVVINHLGLMGRVVNVLSSSCEVVLITDRQSAVGSRIWDTRETLGVVEGMGSENTYLRLIHMPHDADIEIGDKVVTSGLDGIFSEGIPIGTVVEIADEVGGLTKQATIEPYVNFYRLEEVFIILNNKGSGN